ncbi:MAG: heat-inducible transcriptional repressor HrcA [Bacilli bacterium]|nr:heat-inducible transcriptional repressor HrcA [Bacilli bacterium]
MGLSRSDTILKLIVEYFIKHAQPVGSQTLIEEYNLPYSSATIRNEMYALEKMGLIEKPHTSAGRVPSSKGYKYYCEYLRDKTVDETLKYSLQTVLNQKLQSIEEIIKQSCEIISHMTNLVSVVMGPDEKSECLARVQLIPLGDNTMTAIFVTDKGYVENKTFIIPQGMKAEDIIKCVDILNERLTGTPIPDLVDKMESIKPIIQDYVVSHDVIYQAMLETLLRFASDRMALYGKDELFNHPEFKNDADALLRVMKLLENQSVFKNVDDELASSNEDFIVKIGDIEGNPDVALVTAKIRVGNEGENMISLVGPKRMDYDRALAAIEYLINELNNYFGEGGDSNGGEAN